MWRAGRYVSALMCDLKEELYESLQIDDHSEIVMTLYKKVKLNPEEMIVENKSESKSNACRKQGNDALHTRCYRQALIFYNMALCYAPKNSRSLVLAYSNRSALLYILKEFKDALKDIEMCYRLGCSSDLLQKLQAREQMCHKYKEENEILEQFQKRLVSSVDFLKLESAFSNDVPCVSKVVKLDTTGPQPRFVAAEDIDVGTVIALEKAFVNTLGDRDVYLACYHCMKSSLNLIPCDECCLIMFCGDSCRNTAFKEYHDVECKLLHKQYIDVYALALKAVIKMKRSCTNWMEFIETSNNVCMSQIEKCEFSTQITNANPFSLLHNMTNTFIPFGKKISYAVFTAIVIENLENLESYFPSNQHIKLIAMRATAKVLMHLFLYSRQIVLDNATKVSPTHRIREAFTAGFYIFLSKLEHSCHPNLIVTAMNNKALVIALQPIKCGTAFTISYVGHNLHVEVQNRALYMYNMLSATCSCDLCTEEGDGMLKKNYKLSPAQRKYWEEFNLENIRDLSLMRNPTLAYQKICLGLKLFMDLPYSVEYKQLFVEFFNLQERLRVFKTGAKSVIE